MHIPLPHTFECRHECGINDNFKNEYGQKIKVFDCNWYVRVANNETHLGVYLHCENPIYTTLWKVNASFKIYFSDQLINEIGTNSFEEGSVSWGKRELIPLDSVPNHLRNNKLEVIIHVTIHSTVGIFLPKAEKTFEEQPGITDCKLEIGGQSFFVNKAFLANCSQYFYQVFFGNFNVPPSLTLQHDNVTPREFHTFLSIIYDSSYEITKENVSSLLILADYYVVQRVTEKCSEFLIMTSSVSKQDKLQLAETHKLSNLQGFVLNSISSLNEVHQLMSNSWQFGRRTLCGIIQRMTELSGHLPPVVNHQVVYQPPQAGGYQHFLPRQYHNIVYPFALRPL